MSSSVLQQMLDQAPNQITQIESSIESLEQQITDLQEKQDALVDDICNKVATDLESYLIGTKFDESLYSIQKGPNFNDALSDSGSIVDWQILDLMSQVVYTYSPGDDEIIDDFKNSWDFAHDYIVKPLSSTATYGIKDMITNLDSAKTMLENNKSKISDSIEILESFV